MNSNNLKVIIVGGGPVGLTAAHALSRAGIDFDLLESRHSPVIDAGSNLVLAARGTRALSQLGLLDSLRQVSSTLGTIGRIDHQGRDLGSLEWFNFEKENFGEAPRVISRHDLTQVLYDGLSPEIKDRIYCEKRVSNVIETEDGVTVTCRDGSSFSGSFVIGADGAHSAVRQSMRKVALDAGHVDVNEEDAFLTTYRCLWVRFPSNLSDKLTSGITAEAHGPKAATQLFVGDKTGVTGLYERLDEPTRERRRYTQEDKEALVERWAHLQLIPGIKLTLGEVYEKCSESGLVNLEEGVVEHWSYSDKIVLIGDSAHKFTPSTGAGCNNGIIDVVSLANELYKVVEEARSLSDGTNARPSSGKLQGAFEAYQRARRETNKRHCEQSGKATGAATWGDLVSKVIDCWGLPWTAVQKYLNEGGARSTAKIPVLSYVACEEQLIGKTPWVHAMPVKS